VKDYQRVARDVSAMAGISKISRETPRPDFTRRPPVRRIYHLTPRSAWERSSGGPYTADSLASEGFIHCSNADQVEQSANRFFAGQSDVLVLEIDPGRLTSPLRDEPGGGPGELFPHVYGPIDRAAVVAVHPLEHGPDGRWVFSAGDEPARRRP
jgi:uncharacterized protein (DUF952 family)